MVGAVNKRLASTFMTWVLLPYSLSPVGLVPSAIVALVRMPAGLTYPIYTLTLLLVLALLGGFHRVLRFSFLLKN